MATTTEEETTVSIRTEHGSTDPVPLAELNDRLTEVQQRIRQLSFDVGGPPPDLSSLKASLDVLIDRELRRGSEVTVQVTDASGELLAQTTMKVTAVTFEDEYKDGHIAGSERVHKAKAV